MVNAFKQHASAPHSFLAASMKPWPLRPKAGGKTSLVSNGAAAVSSGTLRQRGTFKQVGVRQKTKNSALHGTARGTRPSRTATSRSDDLDLAALLGPVTESREAHLERHANGDRACPRCRWYMFGHRWQATYGSLDLQNIRAGPREKTVWLSERPVRWGGTWALGCSLCADALARRALRGSARASVSCGTAEAESHTSAERRLSGSWARYNVRPVALQAEHVKQHATYDVHKLAEVAFLRPDEPVTLQLQASYDDDRLLAGAVPQPSDWVRLWRSVRECDAWTSVEQHAKTEHWISQIREKHVHRKAAQNMCLVMREVIRARKREMIRLCTSISLSFDDRKGHKLLVFNCDVPLHLRGAHQEPFRRGLLGCLDVVHGQSLAEIDEDKAKTTCLKVMDMIKAFATPQGDGEPDAQILEKFRSATRSIVVDGACQKSAEYLREMHFKNVILICRDPAHMIRIAVSTPLIRTGRFEEQHKMLFSERHALIKDIQYSHQWQARLQACQHLVLAEKGSQGGVEHTLRHFSFAAHRWESFAGPKRQYVCLLNAILICLAGIIADQREDSSKRNRARKCLESMTPRGILEAGLAGDFSEFCMRFIRQWDVTDRDPATATSILNDFRNEMNTLFVKAYILVDPNDPASKGSAPVLRDTAGASGNLLKPKTLTAIAMEQCLDSVKVRVDGEVKQLWYRKSITEAKEVMAEVKSVASDVLQRLDADFSTNALYLCFEAFDLGIWNDIHQSFRIFDAEDVARETAIRRLTDKLCHLCEALQVKSPKVGAVLRASRVALAERRLLPASVEASMRNRIAWAEALSSAMGPSPPRDAEAVLHLEAVLRFYWSFRDGTGDVERALGKLTAIQKSHQGGGHGDGEISYTEACLEVCQEGPQSEEEVAMRSQSEGGPLLLTAFSKHCAQMWLALFGRRFACTRTRGDVGRKYPNRIHGSLQGVKVRHVAATKKLLDIAREDEADEDAASSRRTILGIRQRTLAKVSTEAVPANKGLRHFRTLTQKRLQHKMQFSVWTGFGKAPPKMRRACASAGASATSKDQVARARAFLSRARSSAGAPRAARAKKKARRKRSPLPNPPVPRVLPLQNRLPLQHRGAKHPIYSTHSSCRRPRQIRRRANAPGLSEGTHHQRRLLACLPGHREFLANV